MYLVRDLRVGVLDPVTFVKYQVGPPTTFEPTVFGAVALICRNTDVKLELSIAYGML